MSLIPVANHRALLQDAYPKVLTVTPIAELHADSNAVSKVCFYAVGRPKKLPKVAAVLLERCDKDSRSSGAKGRAGLAVTLDICNKLVSECRSELSCFAEQILKVVELALGRQDGVERDTEIEGRAAALFHAVATFATGPFLGLDQGLAKQYLQCLALLSAMAQLGSEHATSRWIALAAMDGAASSEALYAAASDYDSQIRLIVPALLFNCLRVSISELPQEANTSEAPTRTPPPLDSRMSHGITPPTTPPSPSQLATHASRSLRTVSRLSQGVQLTSKLSAICSWFDRYGKGVIWQEAEFVEWVASSGVEASAVQYRAGVVSWWAEQVVSINGGSASAKPTTLVSTLSSILRGPTTLAGLGIGAVLGQLTSLLVRRAPLGDNDPLAPLLLSAISALGHRIYYFDQMNDIAADIIDSLRTIKNGEGEAASFDDKDAIRAMRLLVTALRGVLNEAAGGNREVQSVVPPKRSPSAKSSKSTNGSATTNGNGVLMVPGQGLRSRKEVGAVPELDENGRTAGRRHHVSAEVFHESLFLLDDADPGLRVDYERALYIYVASEMEVADPSKNGDESPADPAQDATRFLTELHSSIYRLATTTSLVASDSNGRSPTSRPPRRERSRRSSGSSGRKSSLPREVPRVATPADYAGMREIVRAVQGRSSPLAVLAGVPMLLAMEREASKWEEGSVEQGRERAQACREIVATGLVAVGTTWGVPDLVQLGEQALSSLAPFVLPVSFKSKASSGSFVTAVGPLPPLLSATAVIDALSTSHELQAASGFDRGSLSTVLSFSWSSDGARDRTTPVSPNVNVYRDSGSRSVTNLSNLSAVRISSSLHRVGSFRAPSLADLQNSFGHPSSTRTSATPSVASTNGTAPSGPYDTKRRTSRAAASSVLASLSGIRNSSRLSVTPPML